MCMYAGTCERAGDITRVGATWNAARRETHTGDPHRGGPTQAGTHTERGTHRGPTTGGEGHTGNPHRTHTDSMHDACIYVCIRMEVVSSSRSTRKSESSGSDLKK